LLFSEKVCKPVECMWRGRYITGAARQIDVHAPHGHLCELKQFLFVRNVEERPALTDSWGVANVQFCEVRALLGRLATFVALLWPGWLIGLPHPQHQLSIAA